MTSVNQEKHVSFQNKEETDKAPGIGGAVFSAVDTGIGAVAQAGNAVLSHIPGTDEHALHQCKKEIEKTGVDLHVADDIAFECGPATHSSSLAPSDLPKKPHTADDLAYTTQGPRAKNTQHYISSTGEGPKDVNHTADDLNFLRGEYVKPTNPAQSGQRKDIDPHTADDLAFTKGVGAETQKVFEGGVGGARSDVMHTADDLAFTTGKQQ